VRGLGLEARLLALVGLAAVPGVLLSAVLATRHGDLLVGTLAALSALFAGGVAVACRRQLKEGLAGLMGLVTALRHRDFTVRLRPGHHEDALGALAAELDTLARSLHEDTLGEREAERLLRKVLEEIDVIILAFDEQHRLRLANPAAARLFGEAEHKKLGCEAEALGLADCLQGTVPRAISLSEGGVFELRRSTFRLRGRPHQLVVLADIRQTLREEERATWQRLVRVLGHEINNSLAPIQSVSASLRSLAERRPSGWEAELEGGFALIERRAAGLGRFLGGYARLARLPAPRLAPVSLPACARRVVALEQRLPVKLTGGPEVTLLADGDQLEQALINLVANAVEAAREGGGTVEVRWAADDRSVELTIDDDGPGPPATENLFVPFFTTKPEGQGIGLVLSRQIVEAHGGRLVLEGRPEGPGCRVRLSLPVRLTR
jgi:nitrogen fixation/metabolism regulation signal transduction histidine kinase